MVAWIWYASLPPIDQLRPLFPFASIAAAIAVAGVNAYFIGALILRRVTRMAEGGSQPAFTSPEWLFLSLTVGFGMLAWLTLPLGLVLPYSSKLYWAGHGGLLALFAVMAFARPGVAAAPGGYQPLESPRRLERAMWIALACTFAYLAFLYGHVLEGSDGQTNHLNAVMLWIDKGRYVPFISTENGQPLTLSSSQYPIGRLLLLQVALLGGLQATGLFNVLGVALTAAGVFCLGARLFSQQAGRLGALVYLASPVIYRYYVEDVTDYPLNLCLFLTTAVALTIAVQLRSRGWLRLGLLAAGLLLGVKYYSLLQLAIVGALAAPILYRAGLFNVALRDSWLFVVFAALPLGHHAVVFGDPAWPYLSRWTGGTPMSAYSTMFYDSRRHYLLASHLQPGGSTLDALLRFWWSELMPGASSPWAVSPLLVPGLAFFAVASFWRRIYLLPLIFCLLFLAVGLNSVLFNKYLFLIVAAVAPFTGAAIATAVARRPAIGSAVAAAIGAVALVLAWEDISRRDLGVRKLTLAKMIEESEPTKTLNSLPAGSLVFVNLQSSDIRQYRTYLPTSLLQDSEELLVDDWRRLFDGYRVAGMTHYLVQSPQTFPFSAALIERFDPQLAAQAKTLQGLFDRNLALRNAYLGEHATAKNLGGGYVLYTLENANP